MYPLAVVTLLSLAILTGNEFCVAAFVEPTLRSLPEDQQVRTAPAFASLLGRWMPPWYAVNLLLTATLAYLHLRAGVGLRTGAALSLLLQLVVLAVTLSLLVPRNTRLAKMTAAYPAWQDDARQWDTLHRIRVVLLVLATVALVV